LQNYNPDPLLPQLIIKSDLSGLQQFFLDGKGHANDYLPSGEPLLQVSAEILFSPFIFVCLDFILAVPTQLLVLFNFRVYAHPLGSSDFSD
jgi:hypothetical protein